jgi:CRISPR/Cas system-associated exonuclease Cas4 (RecB family)
MKKSKIFLLAFVIPLLMATTLHKYYVSVTEIEYVKEKKSLQIVSRLFVDDLETVLRKRYDAHLVLTKSKESKDVNMYLQRYLKDKFQIKINGKQVDYAFIGKEYETDIVYFYLEIKNVSDIKSFEVVNTLLFDVFEDQQNIVKTNINSQNESFILIPQNDKGLLNFR